MYPTPEQLVAAGRTQVETAIQLANVTLRGMEQIIGLQLDAAKRALAESATGVRALAAIRDPREVAELQGRFIKPNLEKAKTLAAQTYDVATNLRQEVDAVVSTQVADFNKSLVAALDQAAEAAPTGTGYAVSALRTAVTSAGTTMDNMNRLGRQLIEAAEANVASFVGANAGKKTAA